MTAPQLLETLPVANALGEGVIWDAAGESLWWTDIEGSQLYRYHPGRRQLQQWNTPERLACFAPVDGSDRLVAAFAGGFAYYTPETGAVQWLDRLADAAPGTRLNDGRADRQGRFWAGSMVEDDSQSRRSGILYRLDRKGAVSETLQGLSISNGLCWSPDSQWLYHTDTPSRKIYRYPFDQTSGTFGERTLFVTTEPGCFPDGSTVDSQGCVWNAQWGGSQVVRYSPRGEVDLVLPVPVSQPTCVAFGGSRLDCLYVTSARQGLQPDALAQQPEAGNLLIYRTGFTGLPDPVFQPGPA